MTDDADRVGAWDALHAFSGRFTIKSCDAGGTASPGDSVAVGLGFHARNGTTKASAEAATLCPVLPPLMPS